jgi:hypothetical protein
MGLLLPVALLFIAGCAGHGSDHSGPHTTASAQEDSMSATAAVAWIEGYYRAINERHYGDAYARWEQGGKASGKTFEEFRKGFDHTNRVEAHVGSPGLVGAAAGSRYIEIPIRIVARDWNGSEQAYAGSYTLRLSVVDGATPEQRSWHIYSAAIHRESAP